MVVTVRDVHRPDKVLREWPLSPHVGLPHIGSQVRWPRERMQPKADRGRVVDYIWELGTDSAGIDIHMLVEFA